MKLLVLCVKVQQIQQCTHQEKDAEMPQYA